MTQDDPFDDLDLDGTTILGGGVSASTSSFKLTGLLSTSTNGSQSIFITTNHADAHLVDDSSVSGPSHTTTSSAPSNTLVLPRASVRATTFDGKTVFIKRKPKTVNLRVGKNDIHTNSRTEQKPSLQLLQQATNWIS